VKRMIVMASKMKERISDEVESMLASGDGKRLVMAALKEIKRELSTLIDVQAKQNMVKEVARDDLQTRLSVYKELAIASITRTLSALYVTAIVQLVIYTQVFQLLRLKRMGKAPHELVQRKYLSMMKYFAIACGQVNFLQSVVEKVERGVTLYYDRVNHGEMYDEEKVEEMLKFVRRETETDENDWIIMLLRDLSNSYVAECLNPDDAANSAEEIMMGVRMENGLSKQLENLAGDFEEILESDVFAETLITVEEKCFQTLGTQLKERVFHSSTELESEPRQVQSVPFLRIVPPFSNMFADVLNAQMDVQLQYGDIVLKSHACKEYFEAIYHAGRP